LDGHCTLAMAIITVSITNTSPTPTAWEIPGGPAGLRSPVPRGLINFHGTDAIATKIAGNETSYLLTITMPDGFAYLPRNTVLRFGSDDLVAEWQVLGFGAYQRLSRGSTSKGEPGASHFNLKAPGFSFVNAAFKNYIWTPTEGTPKLIMLGGDKMQFYLADMDAGETTAGDLSYSCEFYVFDVDQVDKWEVNTPIPVINQASF